MSQSIRVLEFASSLLRSEADLPQAVHEIYREYRAGHGVVAVVSAFGATADELLQRAEQLGLPPQPGSPAASLTLALDRSGIPFTLLDSCQTGHIPAALNRGVVVVAGSDLAASALARQLGAHCRERRAVCSRPPLRVALLGCGTVGGGVLARLQASPEAFKVIGVAVRDAARAERFGVPRELLVRSAEALVEREADVVVELLGGIEPARSLITRALELGRSVVTANKALLADEGRSLARLAEGRGAALRASASVGGALPALETVRRVAAAGRIQAIAGVLNGTCNYVLGRLAAGDAFDEAVAAAQGFGFAEADPQLDLDGSDSAQKLVLLVREAFGTDLDWRRIPRRGLPGIDASVVAAAGRRGQALRLVAACDRTASGLRASVGPVEVPLYHPFARARGADNALRIECRSGEILDLAGRGAGRWPTTEAVLADLFDLAEERFDREAHAGAIREEVVA